MYSEAEKMKIINIAISHEFRNKSPHQIVPTLADRGEFIASESSFYRVMKSERVLAHRGQSAPKKMHRPKPFEAMKPTAGTLRIFCRVCACNIFINTCSSIFFRGK